MNKSNEIISDFHKAMAPHKPHFTGTIFVPGDWQEIFALYADEEGLAKADTPEMDALIEKVTPLMEGSWEWRKGIQEACAELGNQMISDLAQDIIVDLKSGEIK